MVDMKIAKTDIKVYLSVVSKRKSLPFSETQLLRGLTAKTAHADEIFQLKIKEMPALMPNDCYNYKK